MSPEVSVAIATYNYGRFLPSALDSVLGQTFHNLEVVVVDDGSTDDTAEVVRPYLADSRVRYCCMEHRGVSPAKSAAVRLTRAPLVAFLDADDAWLPAKVEKQVAVFQADPGLGLVYTRRLLVDEVGHELEQDEPSFHRGAVLPEMFRRNFICFSSAMVRRRVLDAVGLFDERLELATDWELWLRVVRDHRIDYVDEPLVLYRTGHANLSRRAEERLLTCRVITQRFLDEHGGRERLDARLVREAEAATCCNLGLTVRDRSRLQALAWYLRAVSLSPRHRLAWKGLASLFVPEVLRRQIRVAMGKPADWSVRPHRRASVEARA